MKKESGAGNCSLFFITTMWGVRHPHTPGRERSEITYPSHNHGHDYDFFLDFYDFFLDFL